MRVAEFELALLVEGGLRQVLLRSGLIGRWQLEPPGRWFESGPRTQASFSENALDIGPREIVADIE